MLVLLLTVPLLHHLHRVRLPVSHHHPRSRTTAVPHRVGEEPSRSHAHRRRRHWSIFGGSIRVRVGGRGVDFICLEEGEGGGLGIEF